MLGLSTTVLNHPAQACSRDEARPCKKEAQPCLGKTSSSSCMKHERARRTDDKHKCAYHQARSNLPWVRQAWACYSSSTAVVREQAPFQKTILSSKQGQICSNSRAICCIVILTLWGTKPLKKFHQKHAKIVESQIRGFWPLFIQKRKLNAINPHQGINLPINHKHYVVGIIISHHINKNTQNQPKIGNSKPLHIQTTTQNNNPLPYLL